MASKKILIIDDDVMILEIYSRRFLEHDYAVKSMTDVDANVEAINEFFPDIILLDVNMPSKSGMDLLKEIKEDEQLKNIKVILLTNETSESIAQTGKKLGMEAYIIKASRTPTEIVELVDKMLV